MSELVFFCPNCGKSAYWTAGSAVSCANCLHTINKCNLHKHMKRVDVLRVDDGVEVTVTRPSNRADVPQEKVHARVTMEILQGPHKGRQFDMECGSTSFSWNGALASGRHGGATIEMDVLCTVEVGESALRHEAAKILEETGWTCVKGVGGWAWKPPLGPKPELPSVEELKRLRDQVASLEEQREAEANCRDEAERELKRLKALQEPLMRVYEAALGLSQGSDWNAGTMAKAHGYRAKLVAAVAAVRDLKP